MKFVETPRFILLILGSCILFGPSCMKMPLRDYSFQPEDQNLSKNIPENTDAKNFVPMTGYTIYVTGESYDSTGGSIGYWKDGIWTPLSADYDMANDFYLDNAHAYIGGSKLQTINGTVGNKAFYWVDGLSIPLTTATDKFSEVFSITKDNDEVYSCGSQYKIIANPYSEGSYYYGEADGLIWKGKDILYTIPGVRLIKIKIINGDVYAAGCVWEDNSNNHNVIFKNGVKIAEDASRDLYTVFDFNENNYVISTYYGNDYVVNTGVKKLPLVEGNSFHPKGACITPDHNVVLVGSVYIYNTKSSAKQYAGLWRDGHFDRVESRYQSDLTDIKIIDNQEFIIGNISPNGLNRTNWGPGYEGDIWINGDKFKLKGPYTYNRVEKLFVVKN